MNHRAAYETDASRRRAARSTRNRMTDRRINPARTRLRSPSTPPRAGTPFRGSWRAPAWSPAPRLAPPPGCARRAPWRCARRRMRWRSVCTTRRTESARPSPGRTRAVVVDGVQEVRRLDARAFVVNLKQEVHRGVEVYPPIGQLIVDRGRVREAVGHLRVSLSRRRRRFSERFPACDPTGTAIPARTLVSVAVLFVGGARRRVRSLDDRARRDGRAMPRHVRRARPGGGAGLGTRGSRSQAARRRARNRR